MKKIILAATLSAIAALAQAQDMGQSYFELGSTVARIKPDSQGYSGSTSANLIKATLGYEFDPTWAAEGMFALGAKDGSVSYTDATGASASASLKVNKAYGLYIKPRVQLTDNLEGYARLGYTRVDLTAKAANGAQARSTTGSFSYGAGLGYAINPQVYVNADYMRYAKDMQGFSGNVGMKF